MNEDLTTIHITEVLSSSLIMDLMDEYPNLSEITCAPSVYERTSKNYIDALEQLDIDVKKKYNWGAKSQTNGQEKVVLDLAKKGLKAREIAEEKQALAEFGSTAAGASLGDILGEALAKKAKKTKKADAEGEEKPAKAKKAKKADKEEAE